MQHHVSVLATAEDCQAPRFLKVRYVEPRFRKDARHLGVGFVVAEDDAVIAVANSSLEEADRFGELRRRLPDVGYVVADLDRFVLGAKLDRPARYSGISATPGGGVSPHRRSYDVGTVQHNGLVPLAGCVTGRFVGRL